MSELIDAAYEHALRVMRKHTHPQFGLTQSVGTYPPQTHTRDSAICTLGYCISGQPDLVEACKVTLDLRAQYQSPMGHVPTQLLFTSENEAVPQYHDVDVDLLYVLAHYSYWKLSGDTSCMTSRWDSIVAALRWMECQDIDLDGLVEAHEASGTWGDIFPARFNVLSINVLWAAALAATAEMGSACGKETARFDSMAHLAKERINLMFWLGESQERYEKVAQIADCGRKRWLVAALDGKYGARPYYLPFLTYLDAADYFDSLGNVLAVLLGVSEEEADDTRTRLILDTIRDDDIARPYPIRCIDPPLQPGDQWWEPSLMLRGGGRVGYNNRPYHFQNGAIWPFMGGFYVAALVRAGRGDQAEVELEKLAEAARLGYEGEWRFNEFHHGLTGRPLGADDMPWTASMYVYAYHCVRGNAVPGLPWLA